MAVQAVAAAALKDLGKRLVAKVLGDGVAAARGEEPSPVGKAVAAVAIFLLLGVWAIVAAPLQLFQMAADYAAGGLEPAGEGRAWAGAAQDHISDGSVGWYCNKADELEAWARETWNSGTGEDTYRTPDWRVLMSFDMAIAENDFELVRANEAYYDELHKRLLKAKSVSRERLRDARMVERPARKEVRKRLVGGPPAAIGGIIGGIFGGIAEALGSLDSGTSFDEAIGSWVVEEEVFEEGARWSDSMGCYVVDGYEDGAVYDSDSGRWVVVEFYRTWDVGTRDVKSLFRGKGSGGSLSDAFKYFAIHESADYSAAEWGDQGNALGFYQFDRRYALDDFLAYAIQKYPGMFDYLEPWAGVGTIAAYDGGLLDAWHRAWNEHPAEWAAAQDEYEYDTLFVPAADYIESIGVRIYDRHDAVKGLVCGLGNQGLGNAIEYIDRAGLRDDMTDTEFAIALCDSVIENCTWLYPNYVSAFQNRYANEKEEVLSLLETSPPGSTPTASACIGKDPSAEGKDLDLETKGDLYESYHRATYAVTVTDGPFGTKSVKFDYEKFEKIVTSGDDPAAGEGATVVERAMSYVGRAEYVWGGCAPGAFDCSGFVAYCLTGEYQRLGTTLTFLTWEHTDDPVPGDVCTSETHCGIYIGDGMMVHCATYGVGVIIGPVPSDMVYVKYAG